MTCRGIRSVPVKFEAERVCPECGVRVVEFASLPFCSEACWESFDEAEQIAAKGERGGEDQGEAT